MRENGGARERRDLSFAFARSSDCLNLAADTLLSGCAERCIRSENEEHTPVENEATKEGCKQQREDWV